MIKAAITKLFITYIISFSILKIDSYPRGKFEMRVSDRKKMRMSNDVTPFEVTMKVPVCGKSPRLFYTTIDDIPCPVNEKEMVFAGTVRYVLGPGWIEDYGGRCTAKEYHETCYRYFFGPTSVTTEIKPMDASIELCSKICQEAHNKSEIVIYSENVLRNCPWLSSATTVHKRTACMPIILLSESGSGKVKSPFIPHGVCHLSDNVCRLSDSELIWADPLIVKKSCAIKFSEETGFIYRIPNSTLLEVELPKVGKTYHVNPTCYSVECGKKVYVSEDGSWLDLSDFIQNPQTECKNTAPMVDGWGPYINNVNFLLEEYARATDSKICNMVKNVIRLYMINKQMPPTNLMRSLSSPAEITNVYFIKDNRISYFKCRSLNITLAYYLGEDIWKMSPDGKTWHAYNAVSGYLSFYSDEEFASIHPTHPTTTILPDGYMCEFIDNRYRPVHRPSPGDYPLFDIDAANKRIHRPIDYEIFSPPIDENVTWNDNDSWDEDAAKGLQDWWHKFYDWFHSHYLLFTNLIVGIILIILLYFLWPFIFTACCYMASKIRKLIKKRSDNKMKKSPPVTPGLNIKNDRFLPRDDLDWS